MKLRAAANQATAQWRQTAEGKEQKRNWEDDDAKRHRIKRKKRREKRKQAEKEHA